MKQPNLYRGRHFSPEIISYAVWLYVRFPLSLRDVEELLAQRGIEVSYETIRRWCLRYGPAYARRLRRQKPTHGDIWMVDEMFLSIKGQRHYLWRAIDQDGDVIDILLQKRRNAAAAKRFFCRLLTRERTSPNRLVTDKLGSYAVAQRELLADVPHDTSKYANNRCEASHRPTREQERQMKGFRCAANAQRFLELHGLVRNLLNWGRHRLTAKVYRHFRGRAFETWAQVTYA